MHSIVETTEELAVYSRLKVDVIQNSIFESTLLVRFIIGFIAQLRKAWSS